MKLLFNNENKGQAELKEILGFLDADFTYSKLESDITINTPYLIDLISEAVYNKIHVFYLDRTTQTGEALINYNTALKYVQIYIASMAYLDFAPNNDLSHSNTGRKNSTEDSEKLAWEWQINMDASNTKKRAYKSLDLLFILLDKLEWPEWTASDAYKTANKLFIKNTNQFDKVFPINKSGQLYYRLVPFMEDFENDDINAIISETESIALKAAAAPNETQKKLLIIIRKAIGYLTLAKAFKTFPVEMFAEGMLFNENTRMKSQARAEVMLFLEEEGKKHLKKLEYEYNQQNQTFETINTTSGLEADKKYVNL
ncbi:DUF6712 family protein [Lacinutrix sp. Hel_I_90]|uniref:DUF6712 family protein n=1 Tax=Lacinutrix sp. Hel_I_90 TaxID=1249999 RepID=UPI000695C98C|nr:DUF6712 family protein [Lacinutrix sp. Hel_I_90]